MIQIQCQCGAILELEQRSLSKPIQCPRCGGSGSITVAQPVEPLTTRSPNASDVAFVPIAEIVVAEEVKAPSELHWQREVAEFNPFESPQAPLLSSAASSSTSGQELMVRDGLIFGKSPIVLPQYCVDCGEPVETQNYKTKTLVRSSPWLALLIFLGPLGLLLMIILYFLTRKKCRVTYGYCNAHRIQRRRWFLGFALTAIGSFFAIPLSTAIFNKSNRLDDFGGILAFSFMLVFIGSLLSLLFVSVGLYIKSHTDKIFAIKGCKPAFLKWIQ